jgi:hypothetical protein
MTNQLSHANLFSDLSNVTLRRVFKTDQGWTIEAAGQDSLLALRSSGPDSYSALMLQLKNSNTTRKRHCTTTNDRAKHMIKDVITH